MDDRSRTELLEPAYGDAPLAPAPMAAPITDAEPQAPRQPPPAWVADRLAEVAREASQAGVVYAASGERRADEIGRALRQFAPDLEVLILPPWDCLPYDRAPPSRESMGRRMAVLSRLAERAAGPRVLVAPVETLLQLTPPDDAIRAGFLHLRVGARLERSALETFAASAGYVFDDRIDEPGEIAILGSVVDIFPAAAEAPVRIALAEDDQILEIRRYDPLSQLSDGHLDEVLIGPASELVQPPGDVSRAPGDEHRASELYGRLVSALERMPRAWVVEDPKAPARAAEFVAQVREAFEARRSLGDEQAASVPKPERLYLTLEAYQAMLADHRRVSLDQGAVEPVPNFALDRNPGRAFSDFVAARLEAGARVVLAGLPHELRPLVRAIRRGLDKSPEAASAWSAAMQAPEGALLSIEADLDAGFEARERKIVLIAAADVLGGRVAAKGASSAARLLAEPDFRVGDVLIHEDHGLGVLQGLETVEVDGTAREALRLEYHGGASLIVPVEDFGRLWRYGAEAEAVTLDRLHTDAWNRRRAELSAEIDRTAERLVELAAARAKATAALLEPPKAAYARFAARFPYPETPDQAAAIEAVLEDLASGRAMRRLVCGDVGFGKTEVALRAAAAAVLCGKQVAVVAPTTVLARQHYETFRRRFSGFDVRVAQLSRLVTSAEADEVKAGLADGSVQVVVGTHALAAADVAFCDLGLLIIDEEQRFGTKIKRELEALEPRAHRLTLSATPIPRTLQLALVGVEDVSIIATPPARRRPIRTFLAPYDPATVRTALLRERRRGGQSFVVTPRIEDIAPLAEELARLVPELTFRIAHGQMPPDEVDEEMVGFAAGEGDVLLATNIIESGLDVPRANTMLVVRADLFGLAQLHQLRGRVGRGRAQGVAYLFHSPDAELPEAARARLATLEAFDRLGSGLAISARDLEIRGAGDLVGEEQAGHVRLIGTALYQKLLARAVRVAKGEPAPPEWTPELNLGVAGALPEAYVPDPTIRINLYARMARLATADDVERFADELEDRFGPAPPECQTAVELARIRALALAAGVVRIDAGPKACAFTLAPDSAVAELPHGLKRSGDRLLAAGEASLSRVRGLLETLAD